MGGISYSKDDDDVTGELVQLNIHSYSFLETISDILFSSAPKVQFKNKSCRITISWKDNSDLVPEMPHVREVVYHLCGYLKITTRQNSYWK